MIRVAYETRDTDGLHTEVVRRVEVVPVHELDTTTGSLRGKPIKILHLRRCSIYKPKTTPSMRSRTRRSYADFKHRLRRHFRRSAWKALIGPLIDQHLIERLEWDEVLKTAGYPTKPFSYHWDYFKEQFHKALWMSPSTRHMLPRLESMDWLQPYLEEN